MDIHELAGTKLGNYEIERLLGRGGMGVVYKARQLSLDRHVALKILPPSLSSDPSFVKRFRREAHAVAKLSHPNIVQIHDIVEEKGLHFFSMEYVEGQTLDEVLKERGFLSPGESVGIISQAALALQHAHDNDIIHRDIKPSNIIIDRRGTVKVMDFGLARLPGRTRLTETATIMGTVDYMSPEQARGDSTDHRTDIWSLGVVLYQMLAGQVPFKGDSEQAVIYSILNEDPDGIAIFRSEVPSVLEHAVQRMLQKDPEKRHENMAAVLGDLRTAQSAVTSGAEKSSPSIAVLPFVDMSSAKDQEYFCDGIAEELINALSQIEDLKVIARTSAFSFRGKEMDVREIGRKLNVGTVLEGSVRKAGNRLRITAQLVDTIGGHHLWSEKFDREMEDIFAIQDEISEDIVGKLKPRLFGQMKPKPEKRKVVDVESYSLCLKARYFWNKSTPEDMAKAIEYYKQAIEKNPNYAIAYAGLADSYSTIAYYGPVHPKDAYPLAREAALKALVLDENLVEAQAALAFIRTVHDWDWDGAERGYKKAIKLNPGYATSHLWYAYYLMYVARFEEAMEEIRKGLELDPLSLAMNLTAWEVFFNSRNYDRAAEILDNICEIDPFGTFVHLLRALTYTQKGLHEEAVAELEKEKKVPGRFIPFSEVWSGVTYTRAGREKDARKSLGTLLELSKQSYVPPFFFAILNFSLKEDDSAFEWLEKGFEERDQWLCYLKILPHIEIIDMVPDSRYQALIKRIGLDK